MAPERGVDSDEKWGKLSNPLSANCGAKALRCPQTMQATQMNTLRPATAGCLVEIIELKWLLRGHGVDVHVERLQSDAEYARRTLDQAAATPSAALRDAAARLRRCLGL